MTARICLAMALVVGVVGCAGSSKRLAKPGQRSIGSIELVGAKSVDAEELQEGLGLVFARDTGQPFGRFLVAQDRRRIQSYYVRRGWFAATVESEVVQRGEVSDVKFVISEGARARLVRVEIDGLPADTEISVADLRRLIPIEDGETFDHEKYELAQPLLPEALAEAGYAQARVTGVILADRESAQAVIRIVVDAGPLSRFGDVKLVGVPEGLERAVRARVRVRKGERYSPSVLAAARTQLYEMGRFSLVRVEGDQELDDDVVDVTVQVAEAARNDLRLGGGVGVDPINYEVRGRAQYGIAAFPWPLTTTRLELRPAIVIQRDDQTVSPRVEAIAALDRLDLIWPRYNGAIEGAFSYLAVEAYTSYGPRARLSLRTPTFVDAVQASIGWQLELTDYTEISRAVTERGLVEPLGLDGVDRVGSYDQSIFIDLRDDRLVTRRGGYFELRAEEGTVGAGGASEFVRLVPDLRGYVSLGSVTGAARVRAGALWGDAPVTRRFYGGGGNGYRGLPERQLSPIAISDDAEVRVPYGGTALLELSAEVRFPLFTFKTYDFGGAMFLDGGDVAAGWGAIDLGHLHWAAGGGVRVLTPIGAVRLDGGYRLVRKGAGEPQPGEDVAFHLSVGEAF